MPQAARPRPHAAEHGGASRREAVRAHALARRNILCYNRSEVCPRRRRASDESRWPPTRTLPLRPLAYLLALISACLLPHARADASAEPPARAAGAIGDTLTVVLRPILSIPEISVPGASFTVEAAAAPSVTGWAAALRGSPGTYPLVLESSEYSVEHERWFLTARVPEGVPEELYDLEVSASDDIEDVTTNSVMIRQSEPEDFYFVQITDTHLPTQKYYYESGADTDTTEMDDLRAVIDDINIMNPAFVLLTGDVVNEGELEEFLDKRYFTRTKRLLGELNVPIYLTAGNHDVGGWDDTPPPDGTARWNWWRFFGWRYLYDPPAGDPLYTQNYSFDFGGAHFVGLEAYDNYDRWRLDIYGYDSFTTRQLQWLADDISAVPSGAPIVAFYHNDFQEQLDLEDLGIDCALWGHIHYTSGSTTRPPFDLSLETVCGGERAMRIVRVAGGTAVSPSEPIDAGSSGERLRLQFDAANDGTAEEITASIINGQPESFEHALVVFRTPAGSAPYEVDAGELLQTVIEGDVAVCYVRVAATALSTTQVTISPSAATGVDENAESALRLLGHAFPNPTAAGTGLMFSLGAPGPVTADVVDVAGRAVRTLRDGRCGAGTHTVQWDLRDNSGARVAAGVYLVRVSSGREWLSEKVVVLR